MKTTLRVVALIVVALAGLTVTQLDLLGGEPPPASSPGTYRPSATGNLDELLDQILVIPDRPEVAGYDRECGTEHACSFGQDWTDDVDVDLGHNGCDTRNDLLRLSLSEISYRPGTDDCVVESGKLAVDPYTGQAIDFRKDAAYELGIDHVYPLARAWDMGADQWSIEDRTDFANDPRNLVAVSGSANSSKSDRGPGEWLPPER